ncbi:hypothetical protein M407DRAFT_6957 [Tulasnella calospora MUT 4182]|uniref:Uncharacterized protein n=1 Tax=Tulasnella calospora MUT 4182 TaxID=1051891 RepID=A0A0C3M2Z4_9AGAM|nr:hypothetical protein M407DRAFT_6957 [Tulasnella calospora MUT 4182]
MRFTLSGVPELPLPSANQRPTMHPAETYLVLLLSFNVKMNVLDNQNSSTLVPIIGRWVVRGVNEDRSIRYRPTQQQQRRGRRGSERKRRSVKVRGSPTASKQGGRGEQATMLDQRVLYQSFGWRRQPTGAQDSPPDRVILPEGVVSNPVDIPTFERLEGLCRHTVKEPKRLEGLCRHTVEFKPTNPSEERRHRELEAIDAFYKSCLPSLFLSHKVKARAHPERPCRESLQSKCHYGLVWKETDNRAAYKKRRA